VIQLAGSIDNCAETVGKWEDTENRIKNYADTVEKREEGTDNHFQTKLIL
jgi:hypothetical protein